MANQPRSEHKKHEENGLAAAAEFRAEATRQMDKHPVLQGWLLLGLGAVLILFSFGYFPILKWGIFAAGIALALWGINKASLIEKTQHLIASIRKRF